MTTPEFTELTPDFSVSPQITPADVAAIAAAGFRAIICNRPDGEAPGQPPVDAVRAEAERLGLAFAFVPVISGSIEPENVADFSAAIDALPAPVFAYCRSGTRCRLLWGLARG